MRNLKGENNPNWKECICQNPECPNGIDGQPKIFYKASSAIKNGKGKYCSKKCANMMHRGKNCFNYKEGRPHCIDCGVEISYEAKRCRKCHFIHQRKENNPNWNNHKLAGENNPKWKRIGCVCQNPKCPRPDYVFYVKSSVIKRGGGKFCCNKCKDMIHSINISGVNHPLFGTHHQLFQDPVFVEKYRKGLHLHPNKPEIFLSNLLNNLLPNEYKYCGDFSFVVEGKCPDFVNVNGQKKLIELFGDYWHKGENPQDRINIFKQYGWDTLVIWEKELKDKEELKTKIVEFNIK